MSSPLAAVDADDDRRLRDWPRLAIDGPALNATGLLGAEVGFVAGSDPVQVTAEGRGVNGAADRQDVLQQVRRQPRCTNAVLNRRINAGRPTPGPVRIA